MPHVDHAVLLLLALGIPASIAIQWRRGLRGGHLAAGAIALFYGHTLVTMLGGHCVDITWGVTHHLPSMTGKPFAYDWRTYSLLLFGALLITQGTACVRAALRMTPGALEARDVVLRRAALVLAIVVPLVPVNAFFGGIIGGASLLTLAVVALGARERVPRAAAALAASLGA